MFSVSVSIDYAYSDIEIIEKCSEKQLYLCHDGHEFCVNFRNYGEIKDFAVKLLVEAVELGKRTKM